MVKQLFLEMLKLYLTTRLHIDERLIRNITFEDRRLLMEFETDPIAFVKSFMPADGNKRFYLMIDEFQNLDNGGQKLKLIYDTIKNLKIILTGSSSLDIKAHVGKFMAGRILNLSLYPFNFKEYLTAQDQRLTNAYLENHDTLIGFFFHSKGPKKRGKDFLSEEFLKMYERFSLWGGYPAVALSKTDFERKKLLSDIYSNYLIKDIKVFSN